MPCNTWPWYTCTCVSFSCVGHLARPLILERTWTFVKGNLLHTSLSFISLSSSVSIFSSSSSLRFHRLSLPFHFLPFFTDHLLPLISLSSSFFHCLYPTPSLPCHLILPRYPLLCHSRLLFTTLQILFLSLYSPRSLYVPYLPPPLYLPYHPLPHFLLHPSVGLVSRVGVSAVLPRHIQYTLHYAVVAYSPTLPQDRYYANFPPSPHGGKHQC